jgi:nucleotide-binding universal stress UspA family protein
MSIQHVLVPLDQSSLSEAALDCVRSVIHGEGQITLLYVVEHIAVVDPAYTLSTPEIAPVRRMVTPIVPDYNARVAALEEARLYLERTAARLHSPQRTVHCLVREGQPAEQILAAAEELKPDAIIMATHGRSGLSRLVMGSVANKVLSEARCPVFLIPQKALKPHH